MRKLKLFDAGFLIAESRRTPMHVGSVSLFTVPDGVDEAKFMEELYQLLNADCVLRPPFGDILKMGPLGVIGPLHWVHDEQLDLDYHVRRSALPRPGRYRELFALVSRLHGTLLDRSRPLWEVHLIEGLQHRQFALYFKVHHCAMDGAAGMHFSNSMLSSDPNYRSSEPLLSMQSFETYKRKIDTSATPSVEATKFKAITSFLSQQLNGSVNVTKALARFASVPFGGGGNLAIPWHKVPRTSFSTDITGARRFVAQSWSLDRIRAVGKAFGGTINDVVLAMCAGALRHYLLDRGELPGEPLKAMVPVSLRAAGDVDSSNAIATLTANLATNVTDPGKRFRVIQGSVQAGKNQFGGMNKKEIELYTQITQLPSLIPMLAGVAGKFPAFSTVISNVPGPREQMYWNGARLDGMYPASIPLDGFALNFTLVSNYKNIDFGITACRHSVPQVQRLIDYLEQALAELEDTCGSGKSSARPKRATARTSVTRRKATNKTATKAQSTLKLKSKSKSATRTHKKTARSQ